MSHGGEAPNLTRALRMLRDEGIGSVWFRLLAKTGIYRRLILGERPLDERPPEVLTVLPFRVAPLGVGQLDAYHALRPDQDAAEVRRRLEAGQWCAAVWLDEEIVGALWLAGGRVRIEYLGRDLELGPDEVYVYDGYTSPAFRGARASPLRTAWSIRHASGLGFRRLLATFLPENQPALPLWNRVGYRRLGVIGYVKLGPWRLEFLRIRPGGRPPGTRPP
jgi:hypothetical protein